MVCDASRGSELANFIALCGRALRHRTFWEDFAGVRRELVSRNLLHGVPVEIGGWRGSGDQRWRLGLIKIKSESVRWLR